MPDTTQAEIAYVLKGFPRLSETFIANEIHLLEEKGLKLRLYSVKQGERGQVQEVVGRIRAPLRYLTQVGSTSNCSWRDWLSRHLGLFTASHGRLFRRHPLRYLRVLGSALAMTWRYRSRDGRPPRKVFVKEFLLAGEIAADLLEQPQVRHLHGHFCHGATTITLFVSGLTGRPFSFTAHAKDIYQRELNPGDLLERKLRAARFATTCTQANYDHLKQLYPDCDVVHTVYHGLDTGDFCPCDGHGEPVQAPLILSVGRFVPKKGFTDLVRACHLLKQAAVPFRCAIVGEHGEDYEAVRDLIGKLGLERDISLLPPTTQARLREIYSEAGIFALPCQILDDGDRDGIPNVLVEAMAMGLPVVSTAVSGIPELVRDERNGLLVEQRDPAALAAALHRLIDSPAERERLGGGARLTVCDRFDAHKTHDYLKQLFLDELSASRCAA